MLLDTNIVLRYILNDHVELSNKSKEIIKNNNCYAPNEVIAEVVYVLSGIYKVTRNDIKKMLILLMNDISFIDNEVMNKALSFYSESNLDFVDCIIAAEKILGRTEISTFDKKLNNFIKRKTL